MKTFRIKLIIDEIVKAESEDDAINEFSLDGYKFDVEEIQND